MEQLAKSVRGTEREKCVRHWLDLLEKSSSRNVMHSPMIVAEPAATGGDEEDEWQQLSSLPASNRMNQQPSDLMAGPFPEKSFRAFFLRSKAFQLLMEGTRLQSLRSPSGFIRCFACPPYPCHSQRDAFTLHLALLRLSAVRLVVLYPRSWPEAVRIGSVQVISWNPLQMLQSRSRCIS